MRPLARIAIPIAIAITVGHNYLVTCSLAQDDNPLRATTATAESLDAKQTRLADRYDQLELLAGRLAELSRATQPRRARLLRQLVAKSREQDIAGRFDTIIDSLEVESLGKAATAQAKLQVDLQQLLDLLLQEDRDKQIESERKRIRKYLAEVKRLIQLQRGVKARTDGGDDTNRLSDDQQKISDSTGELQQEIKLKETSASSESPDGESKPSKGESKPSGKQKKEGDSKDGKNDESSGDQGESQDSKPSPDGDKPADSSGEDNPNEQSPDGESNSGESKPAESKPSEQQPGESSNGEPNPGEPSPSNPSEGQNSPGQPNSSPPSPGQGQGQSQPSAGDQEPSEQSQSPAERAQQRLKRAQQRMQQALEQLEKAKRDDAVDRQAEALRQLEQAKAELERILRQLREEELERTLVLLEARFRKMLDMQTIVYEETKKLDSSQANVPEHEVEIASGRLGRQEREIVREADRALVLLREDGTTVAFPEAIEQARDDMRSVEQRLAEVKIGVITQGLEEDIIAALEETLAALQQAIKEMREAKGQPQQSSGEPGEQQLVDQLAELRMIRALQNRINRRTKRYGDLIGDQPTADPDLIEALDELSLRQERVFRATRDLDSGRNK